jgi:uncharacterized protein (DUF58 family)
MPKERLNREIEQKAPVEVYTNLQTLIKLQYEIRGFSFLPKQPVQSLLTGRHRSKLRGRGLDFEEVRNYVPGDDIRSIDWKVTARTKKPHTKVYTEERERPVFFVVDQSASMFFGSRKMMKSVTAAHTAALGAWKVLAVGDRVGGIVFNDEEFVEVTPKRNRRAVQRFLSTIVEQNNSLSSEALSRQNPGMLNQVLNKVNRSLTHDYLVVIISDFSGLDTATMKLLIQMSRHNDIILAKIYDPLEIVLPAHELVLSDGEQQVMADARSDSLRQKHREAFEKKQQMMIEHLKPYNITVLPLSTVEPASDQIRSLIGARR